jgi:glucan phosphoethanolaminetransferase (alkaline phosphatase superfamily)
MSALMGVLSAFGLSASAGLNAYIPLLVVALMARTPWLKLTPPWDTLSSWWVIGVLVVLLLVETLADKIPAVNHINDIIQTFVRPAAGAVVFAASTNVVSSVHPVLAIICGLLVAGGVHAVKALAVRPAVTVTTGGIATPIVSTAEDVLATVLSILAVVVPVLLGALLCVLAAWVIWRIWRRANREAGRVV